MGIARRSGRPQLPNILDRLPPRFGLLGRTAWLAGWRLPQRGVHIVLDACALGQQAARAGHSVLYTRASRLLQELLMAHADNSFMRRLAQLASSICC